MNQIINPTINLFLYDIRNGLGQNQDEIKNYRRNFLYKLPDRTKLSPDTDFEADYVELLSKRIERFSYSSQIGPSHQGYEAGLTKLLILLSVFRTNLVKKVFKSLIFLYRMRNPYEGYYYPVRLGDTYGLLLDCSVKDETPVYPTDKFAALKAEIETRLKDKPVTIGQTWMLNAVLPDFKENNPESIAQECYRDFMGQDGCWSRDFQGTGNFCGGYIFELWHHRWLLKEEINSTVSENQLKPTLESIQINHHVIIVLYPNREAAKKAAQFDDSWMRLFCFRHKIMFNSAQSRYLKQLMKKNFVDIQQGIVDVTEASSQKQNNSRKLRSILHQAQSIQGKYSINSTFFEYQTRNIKLNLDNYKKRLTTLQIKAESSDLKFLEQFSSYVENKDLLQLEKDFENLRPGLTLMDGLMKSIESARSISILDQQDRDRVFQQTITIIGTGVGGGALVTSSTILSGQLSPPILAIREHIPVSSINKYFPQLRKDQKTDAAHALSSILFSLFMALLFGTVTYGIIKFRKG